MSLTPRNTTLLLLAVCAVFGVINAYTDGLWHAAPVLIISGTGLLLVALPPLPVDARWRLVWAAGNIVGLGVALAATTQRSFPLLVAGLVVMAGTAIIPWLLARK